MDDPPSFGAYPTADDPGVQGPVSKQDAAATAQIALEGVNDRDYTKWITGWSGELSGAIDEDAFHDQVLPMFDKYGRFIDIEDTRTTAAEAEGFVRYSFLAEFELGHLMLVHVYPQSAARIEGVFLRDAETGEVP